MGLKIAIDGPSGAGKSTIAKKLAKKLSYLYVDTGALYRAIALFVIHNETDTRKAEEIEPLLRHLSIDIKYIDNTQQVFLNHMNITSEIRTPEISMGASNVSAHACVRDFLMETQRDIARRNNVIMDGRDIGTVVLPNADIKIFLTASAEERAERRFEELKENGIVTTYEQVLSDIELRDHNDSHREIAPLKKAKDAVLVDSTGKSIDETVDILNTIIANHLANPQNKDLHGKSSFSTGRLVIYAVLRQLILLAFRLYYNLKFEGKQNIPKEGGNIFASNHRSYTDPILLALPTRAPFSFMAKEELFESNFFFNKIITAFGAFPVKRGKGDFNAIDESIKRLNIGRNLAIFPEGTRSYDGTVGRGKSGVALIAAKAQVNVIPVGISFKGKKLKFRSKIIVKFGTAITPEELSIKSTAPSEIKALKTKIMDKITELVETDVNKL